MLTIFFDDEVLVAQGYNARKQIFQEILAVSKNISSTKVSDILIGDPKN